MRFRVTEEAVPHLDLTTGKVMYEWMYGGHNGGNLRFGPDGMLYFGTGDGGFAHPADERGSGQDITSQLSKIMRIDVDHPSGTKPFSIPKDNPFVATPGARGEIWAYGVRNPWRLSFDAKTGALWVGDVGWELWESVIRVERGGNYGWSITEGSKQAVWPDRPRGPTPICRRPGRTRTRSRSASPAAKFTTAKSCRSWPARTFMPTGSSAPSGRCAPGRAPVEICRSTIMPVGFGIGADGEPLICDYGAQRRALAARAQSRRGESRAVPDALERDGLVQRRGETNPRARRRAVRDQRPALGRSRDRASAGRDSRARAASPSRRRPSAC